MKLELFHNLVNLAASDLKFTDEEIQYLADRANEWDIPNDEFAIAMVGVTEGEFEINLPEAEEDRVELIKEMVRLMAADGELAETEKRICATSSGRMGFSTEDFSRILDEVLKC